jgi:hypothetical protein
MAGWTSEELRRIDEVDEITIAPLLAGGEHRSPTIVWAVQAGDDLYVRAAGHANSGWHGAARTSRQARIEASGVSRNVDIADADESVLDQVDTAYRAKYGRRYASIVASISDAEHRATTLRLTPADDA